MKKYFTISDTHSFYDYVIKALDRRGFDKNNPDHYVIICGDAFDRGEQSVEMFNFMKELQSLNRLVYVRGNHEDLLECCVSDISRMRYVGGSHHVSNGTVKTIAHITGYTEHDIMYRTFEWKQFSERINELLDFINTNCVDYFQLGETVFVHGWVPTTCDENKTMIVHENWRDGDWREARWENGMEMWHFGICPDNLTVVCGHWHCSYGWSHLDRKYKEFPQHTHPDFEYSFDPYVKKGLIAIDACTAYSKKVNCVVFDENGEVIDAG